MDQEDDVAGIPEWVVTFGDMMSLLLTFFIMLVSLSEIKQDEQYQALVESIRQQFGHDASATSMVPGNAKPRNSRIANMATMGRARRYNMMRGGDKVQAPVGDHPRVRMVRPGTRTVVGSVLTFEEPSIVLTEQHKLDLQTLAGELGGKPQKIEVRGHTSGGPLEDGSPYADHWELAFRRAKAVAKFFIEDLGIEASRIRIAVAGPHEPYTLAEDAEMQKLNPRVEAYLLDEVFHDLSGTKEERDQRFTGETLNATPLNSGDTNTSSVSP
jgi:chemotaxis protein MotB